ncbi:MAG: hypothetical protein ETSY2_36750 [Candidatus Entotheonella gemina]|uniref:Glycosyltransferase subfamily 4-like N-terminal domain-containing protein n=1 Tax=Candidatus Entotheonella gemina TaxID=1429439 RepID=W4LVB4_9BACT|nr:MAG: hypothetical protein ETSY2_36750 [Candidatus Entotheonella gemina]
MSSKALRVLHVVESYAPDYGGGAAVTTRDVCHYLARRGHEVRVLTVEKADEAPYSLRTEYDGHIRVDRVNLPYFKTNDPEGWGLGLPRWWLHERRIQHIIKDKLASWLPDVVDYHTTRPFGEICLFEIHKHGVPVVATLHDAWLVCARLMLLRSPTSQPCEGPSPVRCLECMYSYFDGSHARAVMKLPWRLIKLGLLPAYRLWRRSQVNKLVAGALARSEFMASVHKPILREPVVHIPLGVNLAGRPPAKVLRPRRMPIRFGFVAGFQQTKGVWHVLDAAATLKADGFLFELSIWGPGQAGREAELAKRDLVDCVRLRGMYVSEEHWEVYRDMDVAIMATTVCEPLGRVPMEAAAVGVPTIAPNVGGIKENIQDGYNGLLYRFRDPQDLQRQMRRILEKPELVQELSKNLLPVLDTREQISEVEAFYYSVLSMTGAWEVKA